MAQETGIYLFCVIQTGQVQSFEKVRFHGEDREVFTIPCKEAAMVAAEVPLKIYHPNKENLLAHQQAIASVVEQEAAVVPISFGNVLKTKADVEILLENLYPQLTRLFPAITNKIELGLKVVAKKEWLESQLAGQTGILHQKKMVARKSKDAGYFDRIKLGEMAQRFMKDLQEEIKRDIHDPLSQLAEAAKCNDPIGEKMLLNGAYLVDRGQEKRFDERVNALHEVWRDKLDFKYTGPWPAYNFINIKLRVEEGA